MAVRLRMQRMGRRHRPFFRVVAVDGRAPRDGKVIEFLGHYDPLLAETDARAMLKADRIDHWLSVGAQPSDRVGVLIKKYGTNGTHLEQQQAALARLEASKPTAPPPMVVAKPKVEEPAAEEAAPEETPVAEGATAEGESAEVPAKETAAATEEAAPADSGTEAAAAETTE